MLAVLLALQIALVAAVVVAAAAFARSRTGLRQLRGRTVVVNTRDDQSLRGVVGFPGPWWAKPDSVVLEAAVYIRQGELTRDEREVSLEGPRAVIPAENIAWYQVLGSS